ncbi:gasdermin-D-like isoform X2 [Macrotis lagotis]
MPSAFESAAKNVVQELSKNWELIPVDKPMSSTQFSPYYLVREKTKIFSFLRSEYVSLNLTLKDILDPSSPEPEVTQHGPFHFTDEVDGQASGNLEPTASGQVMISGQTSVSNGTILEVKSLTVSPTIWDCLQKERKLKKPEPSIIQQLRKQGKNLYVVTEALKTQKEAILKKSRNREGAGKISFPLAPYFQGEGQSHLNTVKTVTVPEGTILAFQVAQLIIQDHWTVLLLPNKNQKTFPPEGTESEVNSQSDVYQTGTVSTVTDFEQLHAEVEDQQIILLTMLDRELQQLLLQALLGLLQSEQDLLHLEETLEQSLYIGAPPEKMEGIKGDILSNLQDHSGQLVKKLAEAFLYLLGTLNALSTIQHQFLIQLLEKKDNIILMVETKLVKEILKLNFNQTEKRTCSLSLDAMSFVKNYDEKLTLTCGLLEDCGLYLSGDEPQFTWNPSALQSLCALYGSLVMLQALSEAC